MPDKLLSSSDTSPSIIQMRQLDREKRRTINVTWLCCAVALVGIVLIGFAFLLKNFVGGWPGINTNFLSSSSSHSNPEDDLLIYPYVGHTYDTEIPKEKTFTYNNNNNNNGDDDIILRPTTIEDNNRGDSLFSQNVPVKMDIVRRAQWGAHAAKRKFFFKTFAIDKAIIMETGTEPCFNVVRKSTCVFSQYINWVRDDGQFQ